MTLTAQRVAELVGGELRGDPTVEIEAIAPLDRAGPRDLTFLGSPKYAHAFASTGASVAIVATELADTEGQVSARVMVTKPHDAVLALLPHLYDVRRATPGIAPTVRLGHGVQLGERVRIDDYVVIGDGVMIGDDTHIYPGATVYAGTRIGARCIVHSGVRLGTDGFGYVFRGGAHEKIPHVGRCLIGNDVEIGANSTIDRGSIDDTVIGDGTKIDNLVHIAHNVRIGRLCLLMAQVGVAGSVHIGDGAILAGQVGVSGHLEVGAGARLAAQAGVFGDIPAGQTWSGYPARPHRESLRASGALFKLPGMIRVLEQLVREREANSRESNRGNG